MDLQKEIASRREALKIHQFGFTTTDRLVINQGVRDLCEMNSCGRYGSSWACPPAVGTVEECRSRMMKYKNVFVFSTVHELEDSFDFEGMMAGKETHENIRKKVVDCFRELVPGELLILSGDSCSRCKKCTYPSAPCRFPGEVCPTVESYGVEVYRLAQTVQIDYINGKNTVTYFCCILYGSDHQERLLAST